MTQADHYREQAVRARRLAEAVKDPEASQKLIEMAYSATIWVGSARQSRWRVSVAAR